MGRTMGEKRAKKVRWGVVQTRQFDSEAHEEDDANQNEYRRERKHAYHNPVYDKGREERKTSDLWASVETDGEHEHWGPTERSDGQLE